MSLKALSDRTLDLTSEEYVDRIKELCEKSGIYNYDYMFDIFGNGIMMELEISYRFSQKKRILIHESRFVKGQDLQQAKAIISAIVLEKLGFEENVEEENVEENENTFNPGFELKDVEKHLEKLMTEDMKKNFSDMVANLQGKEK